MIKIEEFKEDQVIIWLEGSMTSSRAALIRNELFQLVESEASGRKTASMCTKK